jgi:hypothetical protein
MKALLAVVLLSPIVAAPANADVPVKMYLQARAQGGGVWSYLENYLFGVAHGIEYTNAYTEEQFHRSVICAPKGLDLNQENIISIIDDELKAEKAKPDDIVELVLFFGMLKTFPCKK